jgi:hypothetical protein
MSDHLIRPSKRVLEPQERIAEVLFGLIMVLTFTGTLSVSEAGRDDVRTMLLGALGCNLAWGIIDGVFYLMGSLAERSRDLRTWRAVKHVDDPRAAHQLIVDARPPVVRSVLRPEELESIRERIIGLPDSPDRARLDAEAWRGSLGVFLLVFLSTFPVTIPFLVMSDARLALRISNGIAMALLLAMGLAYGRLIGRRPWLMGVVMVLLGGALVGITIALGG